jgi:hypothetical protein
MSTIETVAQINSPGKARGKRGPRITVKAEQAQADLAAQAAGVDPAEAKKAARRAKDKARREAKKAAKGPSDEQLLREHIAQEKPLADEGSQTAAREVANAEAGLATVALHAKIGKAIAKAAAAKDGKPVPVATGVYVAGNGNFLLERVGDSKAWTACGIVATDTGLRFGSKVEHPTSRAALRSLTVAS